MARCSSSPCHAPAVKAVYELACRPFYWDKTAHGIFDGNIQLAPAGELLTV